MARISARQKAEFHRRAELFAQVELFRAAVEERLGRPVAPVSIETMALARGSCVVKVKHTSFPGSQGVKGTRMRLATGDRVSAATTARFVASFPYGPWAADSARLKRIERMEPI